MKTTVLFLLLILSLSLNAAAQTSAENAWIGEYDFNDAAMNANKTRSYTQIYTLQIKRENNKLQAVYSVVENSEESARREVFDAAANGDTLSLTYNRCYYAKPDENDPAQMTDQATDDECVSREFKKGDLMLKLVKNTNARRKTVILTYWGKIKLYNQTGKVYFVKRPG